MHGPSWIERVLPLAILLFFFIVRLGYKELPMERDEGAYILLGQMLLEGKVPYIDFYEVKPPGLFYTSAAFSLIAGHDPMWLHVEMAFIVALTGYLLYLLAASWAGKGPALVTLTSHSILAMSPHASGPTTHLDHLIAFFVVSGLLALNTGLRTKRGSLIVLAGALLCWSFFIKQTSVFLCLFAIVMIPLENRTRRNRDDLHRMAKDVVRLALGAFIPMAFFAVMFVVQDSFDEFLLYTVEYAEFYANQVSRTMGWKNLKTITDQLYREAWLVWSIGGLGTLVLWWSPLLTSRKLLVSGLLLASAMTVAPGYRFTGHYFLHFFPGLAMVCGSVVPWLAAYSKKAVRPWVTAAIAPVLAGILLAQDISARSRYYFTPDHYGYMRSVYYENPFPEGKLVSAYLNLHMKPGDGLLVLGSEPQIHVYTRTAPLVKHFYMASMMQGHPDVHLMRKEWTEQVATISPRYVVWVQHTVSWIPAEGMDQDFLAKFWVRLTAEYVPIIWYEQVEGGRLKVVTGPEAATYVPRTKLYMFLAERRSTAPASPPAQVAP